MDHLGIDTLLAVAGAPSADSKRSNGRSGFRSGAGVYPPRGLLGLPPMGIALNVVAREAILNDPHFRGGDYYDGPGPTEGWGRPGCSGISHTSAMSLERKFGRRLQDRST